MRRVVPTSISKCIEYIRNFEIQTLTSNLDDVVEFVSTPLPGKPNSVAFCNSPELAYESVQSSNCTLLVIGEDFNLPELKPDLSVLRTNNPRLVFSNLLEKISVDVNDASDFDENIAYSAEIRNGNRIYPGVFISKFAILGKGCVIYPNVTILGNVTIGNNVTIGPGTCIGGTGFGFERNIDGSSQHFPHFGGVIIGNEVSIGANSCIDQGTIDDTVIQDGVHIDNLVHIAHNVVVYRDSLIIAGSILCGGSKIYQRSWIAPGAIIKEKVHIGSDSIVGLGAVVLRNVAENQTVIGMPAKSINN